jgi:hypothetical protein
MPDEFDLPPGAEEPLSAPESRVTARTSASDNAPRPASDSFRRSEAWIAMQIARAAARGQRVL